MLLKDSSVDINTAVYCIFLNLNDLLGSLRFPIFRMHSQSYLNGIICTSTRRLDSKQTAIALEYKLPTVCQIEIGNSFFL